MTQKRSKDDVIAPVEKRLTDLHKVGIDVTIEDPDGDDIVVWVRKLTPAQEKEAVTRSRPAKARIASVKRLPEDSEEKWFYYDQLDSERFSTLRKKQEYLVANDVAEFAAEAEERIASEGEWAEEDYLISLRAAFNEGGLKHKYAADPEDAEAKRVFRELQRFTAEVQDAIQDRENELIFEIDDLTEEEIDRRVVRRLIEDESISEQYAEYNNWKIFYATRYADDHEKQYFTSREEIDELAFEPKIRLLGALMAIGLDGVAGKG